MPTFEYSFLKNSTGRKNKGRMVAYDALELHARLEIKGIVVTDIKELQAEPATPPQLEYLQKLSVVTPKDISKAEASDLISNALERTYASSEAERNLAHHFKIEVSRFISKQRLYSYITRVLMEDATMDRLLAWYVYRVYRVNFNRANGNGIRDVSDLRLAAIAAVIIRDDALLRSLKIAASTSTSGFRWFGEYTTPDGSVHQGDSKRTGIYKAVLAEMHSSQLIPPPALSSPNEIIRHPVHPTERSGCAMGFSLILAAPLLLSFLF